MSDNFIERIAVALECIAQNLQVFVDGYLGIDTPTQPDPPVDQPPLPDKGIVNMKVIDPDKARVYVDTGQVTAEGHPIVAATSDPVLRYEPGHTLTLINEEIQCAPGGKHMMRLFKSSNLLVRRQDIGYLHEPIRKKS